MAIYNGAPSVGLRNVGSYQISGEPWISGSGAGFGTAHAGNKVKRYQFPFVTREVTVDFEQDGAGGMDCVWVHFVSGSDHDFSVVGDLVTKDATSDVFLGKHFVVVSGSFTIKAKLKEIYVTTPGANAAEYHVIADLTNIPTKRMYPLTGSGHTDNRSFTA